MSAYVAIEEYAGATLFGAPTTGSISAALGTSSFVQVSVTRVVTDPTHSVKMKIYKNSGGVIIADDASLKRQ